MTTYEVSGLSGHLSDSDATTSIAYVSRLLLKQASISGQIASPVGDCNAGIFPPAAPKVAASVLTTVFEAVSLGREMRAGSLDRHGRFDEAAITWDCSDPWVNRLANRILAELGENDEIGATLPRPFRVIITHDVDRVSPTEPTSLLKALCGAKRKGTWLGLSDAVKPRLFLKALEQLLDLESQLGVRPWFFMLAGRYGLGRYSNRYGIRWKLAREIIQMIKEAGGEIGLHGSYHAKDWNSYAREASLLGDVVGKPILAHRNHYLRFDPRKLWSQLEAAGIRLDFSLCFSSRMGFRVPVTGPFQPFNWQTGGASKVSAIPTVAMDRPWWPDRRDDVLNSFEALLGATARVGGSVAILVHPEVFGLDTRWFGLFKEIVGLCRGAGALMDATVTSFHTSDDAEM